MVGLSDRSGRGIVVGIIDSGIDTDNVKLMERCKAGGTIITQEGRPQFISGEFSDVMGHGTAVANIIASKATEIDFFIVKVFHDSLVCDSEQLSFAIDKCVEFGCHVINISAGLCNSEPGLLEATQAAAQRCHLVCACSNQENITFYPAAYPWCFGVASGNCRKKYDYFFDEDHEVEFIARGDHQRLTWLSGTQVFMGGASFAASHVSAIIALLLEENATMGIEALTVKLRAFSLREPPQVVHILHDRFDSPYAISDVDKNALREDFFPRPVYAMKRVAVKGSGAPFFEQIQGLLDYQIVDISEELVLDTNLEVDTVILTGENDDIDGQLLLEAEAIKLGKRVFYFMPNHKRIERRSSSLPAFHDAIRDWIFEYTSYSKQMTKYPYVAKHGVRSPIAGFLSAEDSPMAHACFVKLCYSLRQRGYKVAIFDGTADSFLYGGDISFPCNSQLKIETDFSHYVPSIRTLMQIADICGEYDLIMTYNTGRLCGNQNVNGTMRYTAFLIGALMEGFFSYGTADENEHKLIQELTKSPLIKQVDGPCSSDREINEIADALVSYFR